MRPSFFPIDAAVSFQDVTRLFGSDLQSCIASFLFPFPSLASAGRRSFDVDGDPPLDITSIGACFIWLNTPWSPALINVEHAPCSIIRAGISAGPTSKRLIHDHFTYVYMHACEHSFGIICRCNVNIHV